MTRTQAGQPTASLAYYADQLHRENVGKWLKKLYKQYKTKKIPKLSIGHSRYTSTGKGFSPGP